MNHSAIQVPLFPLPISVLPGEEKGLHIFEPRYKLLIAESIASHKLFAIPHTRSRKILESGTQVRVSRVMKKYEDGRFDVMVEGVSTFELQGVIASETPDVYGTGMILINEEDMHPVSHTLSDKFFSSYFEITGRVLDPDDFDRASIFRLAVKLPLSEEQKFALIAATTLTERETKLSGILDYLLLLRKQEDKVKGKLFPN